MITTDPDEKFDYSDTLEEILEVAAELVEEHAPLPGKTRPERMARFLVANLGDGSAAGDVDHAPGWVWFHQWMTVAEARAAASALLRAALLASR